MSATEIWQQKREVVAGSSQAIADGSPDDMHMDVSVTHNKDGLVAEASIYNIAHDTWKGMTAGEPFRISLGYHNGPFATCILGVIQERLQPERDGGDYKYTFKGRDESGASLRGLYRSHTWIEPAAAQIATDIAGWAGLSTGVIDVPPSGNELGKRWSITKEHNARHWLDKLVDEANDAAGEQHHAYAREGKLHLKPKSESRQAQALQLSDGKTGNVIQIDEAQGKDGKTGGGAKLDVEAVLDPRVSKDALVSVDTEDYSGTYRMDEYELTSSTENGDHTLKATLAPTSAKYNVIENAPPPRSIAAGTAQPLR